MPSLLDVLGDPARQPHVVRDCAQLIDAEVADKSGMSGLALKAAYKAVKGIKPGFIDKAVTDLLPEFASALDPIYQEALSKAVPVQAHFTGNSGRVADALLAITDGRAERSHHAMVRGTYEKLRGTAKKNVEGAVPRLASLIARHTG